MFHLFTHAFFKALLFLGAGAVIHALHHEQDIWKMGGLSKKMPSTFWTLRRRHARAHRLPVLQRLLLEGRDPRSRPTQHSTLHLRRSALVTAFLTAFYMTRLFVVVFLGKPRTRGRAARSRRPAGDDRSAGHPRRALA